MAIMFRGYLQQGPYLALYVSFDTINGLLITYFTYPGVRHPIRETHDTLADFRHGNSVSLLLDTVDRVSNSDLLQQMNASHHS